ncbi:MAG: transglutaminase-like domain-containing protein [Lachnospiraceae bacterium]|nr:transglutaminase-like domain-containing protein [Lachnospiraceae bacterium]
MMPKEPNKTPITEAEMECSFSLKIRDDVFKPGRVRVHLPAPINTDWLYMGQVLRSDPQFRMMSIEDHPQRSAWFDEVLDENREFSITYAFESAPKVVKIDTDEINSAEQPGRAIDPKLVKEFEEITHCDCTSYTGPAAEKVTVMDLASEKGISVPGADEAAETLGMTVREFEEAQGKTGDLIKRIFDHCAGKAWKSVRFREMGNIELSRNEMLVALMRASRIPARWQGGFRLVDGKTVPADWAVVHAAPYGWMYMDAQAAHEALEENDSGLAYFYFGGIDALRIPTASRLGAGLYPARDYRRSDERYNLFGEVEFEDRGLEATEFLTKVHALCYNLS